MVAKIHKLLGTTPNEGVQPKEIFSYSIAGLGQNLICGLISAYLMFYYTNALNLNPIHVGILMLCARIFDACNDPIMGSIVDRTRSKWGKCRPYLLFTPIPIAILTVLCFTASPTWAYGIKLTYVAVSYVIWSIIYTIIDVPYWGLATGMTKDTNVRGTMLTIARLLCTAGSGLVSLVIPLCIQSIESKYKIDGVLQPGMEAAYSADLAPAVIWISLVIVILAVPTFYIGYKFTKERYYDDEQKPATLGHNLKALFKNKPLMLIVLSGILGSAKTMFIYIGIYFATYNCSAVMGGATFLGMKGAGLNTLITMSIVPAGLVASLLVPWCTKKFGKRDTFIWSHIIVGILMFAAYFIGWNTPAKLLFNLFVLVVAGIPSGFSNIITYAMIGDTVDYLENETGERSEGICFAMQTFINKIGMAFGAFISLVALGMAHIDPLDASTQTIANNEKGLNMLYFVIMMVSAISTIICVIPMFFYKFNEKQQALAVAAIEAKKLARDEAKASGMQDSASDNGASNNGA
ncbi:MAG: glycoside-pentoside-hexuronide (GPH):cation symporter, partial [Clostridia bacterium]